MPKNLAMAKITIPKQLLTLNTKAKKMLASEVVEYIRNRTQKGRGKNGNPWARADARKYSKGNNKVPPVDLTLTGNMLDAVKLLRTRSDQISIGISINDKDNWNKAKGNILGSYGGKPNPKKARKFMEFGRRDLRLVLDKVQRDLEKEMKRGVKPKDFTKKSGTFPHKYY